VIDVETRTIKKGGRTVYLQPIEYDLMVTLIRHKNCSLSRERLLLEIWGFDYVGETRTVDTHISSLRRKLGLADAIISIPKIGYRLEVE
jgi:DNA-binding response OmpR family regulator